MLTIANAPTIDGHTPFAVDDWLVFTASAEGVRYVYTECEPEWSGFSGDGYTDDFFTAPRTALVGIRMLRRGAATFPVEDPDEAKSLRALFRDLVRETGRDR